MTLANRNSLADQVRERVLNQILRGELKPGDALVEMQIAQAMGISQAPVREGLRDLESIGVVASRPNRGSRVCALDLKVLAEIYDVRAELESYAAALVARRQTANIEFLTSCIAEMQSCAGSGHLPDFAAANAQFHRSVVEAAGNRTLIDVWNRLDVRARTMLAITNTRGDLSLVADSHWPVLKALQARTARSARTAMRSHILAWRPNVEGDVD